jgi:hypothetical protein
VTAVSNVALSVSGPTLHTVTFTSSTTWTAPSGVSQILISGCGGGGGGGGGQSGYGGGGGGGAVPGFFTIPVTANDTYTVYIGSGGAGGAVYTQGSAGGATQLTDGGSNVYVNFPGASGGGGGAVAGPIGGLPFTLRGGNVVITYANYATILPSTAGQGGNGLANGADAPSVQASGAASQGGLPGTVGSGYGGGGGGGCGPYGPGASGGNGGPTPTVGGSAGANTGAGGGGGGSVYSGANEVGGEGGSGIMTIQYWV